MPKNGGARPGSGRKPGSKNSKNSEKARELASDGKATPLEVMIKSMRHFDELADKSEKVDEKSRYRKEASAMATAAAPYLHPRLQPVDGRGSTDMNINVIIRRGIADGD